jgi:hypothetical protein
MQSFEKITGPTWLLSWSWWFVYLPFAMLEIRLLWEQTWLTWTQGSQMIGFTLMHVYPELLVLGVFCAIGTALWVLVAVIMLGLRRNKLLATGKVQLFLSVGTLVLAFLPIDRWVLRFR